MKPGQPPGVYGEAMKAKRNGFLPSALIDRDVSPPRVEGAGGFVPAVMSLREDATIDSGYCLTKDCLYKAGYFGTVTKLSKTGALGFKGTYPRHINTRSRRALR